MATRNPVNVLPEPVGEATSTSRPAAMAGQAPDCGGVGPAGKRLANQLATAGWKRDSGEAAPASGTLLASGGLGASDTLLFHQDVVTRTTATAWTRRSAGGLATPGGDHGRLGQIELARSHRSQMPIDLGLG